MKKILITLALIIGFSAQALPPKPYSGKPVEQVYINANIHVGNGQVMKNAQFAIKDGKITRAGYYKIRLDGSEIDLKGKHIYPGFILTNTDLGLNEIGAIRATIDGSETGELNPNIRSLVAYNTDSEKTPTLRFNGILLAQSTPGGGLVSGTSSVVQLDAWNWDDAVIKADDAMHVNWPSAWAQRFDFSTFTFALKEDKKHTEKTEKIKKLFLDAKADRTGQNSKLNAVKPVLAGERKVFIHADSPKAILSSVQFFKNIGINDLVLVTDQAAVPVADFIKKHNVPVIVESIHALPNISSASIDAAYQVPAQLADAGILTAITYPGSMSARNLGFIAGTSVAYGNDSATALSMITLNAAKILGIDDQYGSLELGKSATFFISEGDALDMQGNRLVAAYIDGRPIELPGRQQALYERFKEKLDQ